MVLRGHVWKFHYWNFEIEFEQFQTQIQKEHNQNLEQDFKYFERMKTEIMNEIK
jgi:hypothetical protein